MTGDFEAVDPTRHYFSIIDARKPRLENPRSIHKGSTEASHNFFVVSTADMVPFELNDIQRAQCAATVPTSKSVKTISPLASSSPELGRRHDLNKLMRPSPAPMTGPREGDACTHLSSKILLAEHSACRRDPGTPWSIMSISNLGRFPE